MTDLSPSFAILNEGRSPFVFNSPHSGRRYPDAFLKASRLDPIALRKSEDCYVDELFAPMVNHGATFLHALFPRAYIDVNREPFELDPQLFPGRLPSYANTQSLRVLGGLGTIARVVSETEEIYAKAPSLDEALERINQLYWPYHHALRGLLDSASNAFGYVLLVDCHSMPSISTLKTGYGRPDFVLGDRYGTSCDRAVSHIAEEILKALGYAVAHNAPYAGGYVTEYYGRPAQSRHALQIEVNRALYMDEKTYEKTSGFDRIQADLETLGMRLIAEMPSILGAPRLAAE